MSRLLYGEELASEIHRLVRCSDDGDEPGILTNDSLNVRVTQGQLDSLESTGYGDLMYFCRYDPEIVRDLTPEMPCP